MTRNRKRVALIGKIGSGKTTLRQRLTDSELKYKKTQMIDYTDLFIDTPGEFIELPFLKRQAIHVTMEAGLVILVSSAVDPHNSFSPNFVHTYNIPTIGVITKIDEDDKKIRRSRNHLIFAGIHPKHIYEISALTGDGIEELDAVIHRYMERHRKKSHS